MTRTTRVRRVHLSAVLLCALLLFGWGLPAQAAGQTGEVSLDVAGQTRVMTVIRAGSVGESAPLIVLLHGGGQSMRKVLERGASGHWKTIAAREGALLIAPNGTAGGGKTDPGGDRQRWNDHRRVEASLASTADDVAFIRMLIEWAAREHGIDRERVYITGASNGGMMTYRMLIEAPELFAGGAAFIAGLPEGTPDVAPGSLDIRVFIANGTDDPLMPWTGGKVANVGRLARQNRGRVLSGADTKAWWVAAGGAAEAPVTSYLPDTVPGDGCRLKQEVFPARSPGGQAGGAVLFLTMESGGHYIPSPKNPAEPRPMAKRLLGLPCRDAEGAELAWAFWSAR